MPKTRLSTEGHVVIFSGFLVPSAQALRKAVVVELLMGDIPERSVFEQKDLQTDLARYRDIVLVRNSYSFSRLPGGGGVGGVAGGYGGDDSSWWLEMPQAVRSGDLCAFGEALSRHGLQFQADGTYRLLTRLHHNVIRAGLRIICLSYSRIKLVRPRLATTTPPSPCRPPSL